MDDEKVDIVNEEDVVISTALKSEAHAQGLLHRVVLAEVVNEKGEWLLVKQAADRQDPGLYVNPVGGHVGAGESTTDALKREVQEELNVAVNEFEFIGKAIFNREVNGKKENHLFIVFRVHSEEEPKLNHEAVSYQRFSVEQIKSMLEDSPQVFGKSFIFVANTFFPDLFT
ncbi:MAG: NUDIX domain-containing protein [Patescibacteria group bacterium]|jgi:isopentenyl-diphosphate delta-isomerase